MSQKRNGRRYTQTKSFYQYFIRTGLVSDKLATNSDRILHQKSNFSDIVSDRLATMRNFNFFDFRAKLIKRPMSVNGTFDIIAERMSHQQML